MKQILRGLSYLDRAEKDLAKENLGEVKLGRLLNLSKAEGRVFGYITDFLAQHGEAPDLRLACTYFEQLNETEAVTLLEEVTAEIFLSGASFKASLEEEIEKQAAAKLVTDCKMAVKIAVQGVTLGQKALRGTDDAVSYLYSSLQTKPKDQVGKLASSMRKNATALVDLYTERKNSPNESYGVPTGYGLFDQSTAGIKKKQLFLCAGFGGHLKSTLMHNMILNAALAGWNPILFTTEEPAEEVQQKIVAMHSANPIFQGHGRPLNSFRLLLGALRPEEEKFYLMVKDHLLNDPNHGNIRVVDAGEFTTLSSISQRLVKEDAEEEVDILWVDYITRLPVDAKYSRLDLTTARNETIADAKRLAMSFKQGLGLPVASPLQVNRQGFKHAVANEGRMDSTALAQYNAAEKEADTIIYVFYGDEEMATSEPKVGMIKSRWGSRPTEPVKLFVEPDSRRVMDLTVGMNQQTGYAPTAGGKEEQVAL